MLSAGFADRKRKREKREKEEREKKMSEAKTTFRPSEDEAGSAVIGKLVRKDSVETKYGDNIVYEIETIVSTVSGKEMPLIVVIWGSKMLNELMRPAEVGDMITLTYKGKVGLTFKDGNPMCDKETGEQFKAHDWEVEISTAPKQETLGD